MQEDHQRIYQKIIESYKKSGNFAELMLKDDKYVAWLVFSHWSLRFVQNHDGYFFFDS